MSFDEGLLRRAIELSAVAVKSGNGPYGSLLAGPDGTVFAEEWNTTTTDNDITAHPELKLARWAARELDPNVAATTTMYTSCQPCGMCYGAIQRSGLGRVVFALTGEQAGELTPGEAWPEVPHDGPHLYEEARVPFGRPNG
ncbi:MAG TPA: nucleoside deaminase [Pseudonocardiaceae bacterium]|nr:nucleoside deaminase [Pseudonocardiaceae bacterium]